MSTWQTNLLSFRRLKYFSTLINQNIQICQVCCMADLFTVFSVCLTTFFVPYRWRIPQLSSLFPIRLCNQRVWLEVEPYHLFHRPHVLLGPRKGPQESVPRAGHGPNTAHWRWKPPEWLSLLNCGPTSRQSNRSFTVLWQLYISHPLRIKVRFMRALTTFCLFLWGFL